MTVEYCNHSLDLLCLAMLSPIQETKCSKQHWILPQAWVLLKVSVFKTQPGCSSLPYDVGSIQQQAMECS